MLGDETHSERAGSRTRLLTQAEMRARRKATATRERPLRHTKEVVQAWRHAKSLARAYALSSLRLEAHQVCEARGARLRETIRVQTLQRGKGPRFLKPCPRDSRLSPKNT